MKVGLKMLYRQDYFKDCLTVRQAFQDVIGSIKSFKELYNVSLQDFIPV